MLAEERVHFLIEDVVVILAQRGGTQTGRGTSDRFTTHRNGHQLYFNPCNGCELQGLWRLWVYLECPPCA